MGATDTRATPQAPKYVVETLFEGDDGFAKFGVKAQEALEGMSLGIADHKKVVTGSDRLKRFMNRILGVQLELQDKLFSLFTQVCVCLFVNPHH